MHWLLLIFITPYIYLLSRIYRSLTQIRYYHPKSVQGCFLSVVVACRNEGKNLPFLLSHLSEQDYNPDLFEIIIVDDNSDDNTSAIASGFSGIKNLIVLQNSERGKKSAIREGISVSKGNLIVTTDADCRMGPVWLKTIASFFEENRPEMIILPVEMEGGRGLFGRFQEIEFLSLQGITAGTTLQGRPVMCNGANLAFTKEVYNRYSGNLHDELISGDDVFLLHGIKSDPGNKIMWLESAEVRVSTNASETLSAFFRQRARWISKVGAYKDTFTRDLGIVTFVTICLQLLLLIAGIFNPDFFWVFAAAFLLKSIPDYLIVLNTTKRYGRKSLMGVFLPAQIVYPLYIVAVFFSYLFGWSR
jgi:glycosyltransferase involved in cell wall biosynthesis